MLLWYAAEQPSVSFPVQSWFKYSTFPFTLAVGLWFVCHCAIMCVRVLHGMCFFLNHAPTRSLWISNHLFPLMLIRRKTGTQTHILSTGIWNLFLLSRFLNHVVLMQYLEKFDYFGMFHCRT